MDNQGHITAAEVRQALKSVYRVDPETNLQAALRAALADDLKPVDVQGRWKPNPLLIIVLFMLAALAGVFVYFTIGGPK